MYCLITSYLLLFILFINILNFIVILQTTAISQSITMTMHDTLIMYRQYAILEASRVSCVVVAIFTHG